MATTDNTNGYPTRPGERKPTNGLGITGFVLSLIGIVTCGTLNVISLPLSLVALLWRPRGLAIAGTFISIASLGTYAVVGLFLITTFQLGKTLLTEGEKIYDTHTAISDASSLIERYRSEHNTLPDGIVGKKLVIEKKDGWGTELSYEVEGDSYLIRSAGPDKQFYTEDDLTSKDNAAMEVETNLDISTGEDGMHSDGPITVPSDGPIEVPADKGTDSDE